MATLGPQITATGISSPDYSDILAELQNGYYSIYGSDAVLTPDSQDGQLLAIFAQAIYDCGQSVIAAYNSFSPATAQGSGLSSVVKINGLARKTSSASQCVVTLVGQTGTQISNGVIGDNLNLGTQWALPALVTIPSGGSVQVTATCTAQGAVSAAPGILTQILTPTFGWQSVTNAGAATPGLPIEDDATLRQRQSQSTAISAQTVLEAVTAAVANVTGVGRLKPYENDTDTTDANGLPPHSIALVVEGGEASNICAAIAQTKSPGCRAYGTTQQVIIDANGVPNTIGYFPLSEVSITVAITIKALAGYVSTTGPQIIAAVVAYLEQLGIGVESYLSRLYAPANLSGDVAVGATGLTQQQLDALSATYNITSVQQSRGGASVAVQDVAIAFNEAATSTKLLVTVTVT